MFPDSKPDVVYLLIEGLYFYFCLDLPIDVQVDAGHTIDDITLAERSAVGSQFAVGFNMAVLGGLLEFHDEEEGEGEDEQKLNVDLWHIMVILKMIINLNQCFSNVCMICMMEVMTPTIPIFLAGIFPFK